MKVFKNTKNKLKIAKETAETSAKKTFKAIKIISVIALIVITLISTTWAMYSQFELYKKDHPDIIEVHITEKLSDIAELATQEFTYTNQSIVSDATEIIGTNIVIPGTTNTINVFYSGVIKVGYNFDDLKHYTIDNTLFFVIPEPLVLDNYIVYDNLVVQEKNNILNPISSDDIMGLLKDIESKELKSAENAGIYEKAENKLKEIITNFFPEYKIKFL